EIPIASKTITQRVDERKFPTADPGEIAVPGSNASATVNNNIIPTFRGKGRATLRLLRRTRPHLCLCPCLCPCPPCLDRSQGYCQADSSPSGHNRRRRHRRHIISFA
ncbi:unnamed protein product, partial [Ectocarpus sp. 12 AP-2014]